jgi:hypothetical protein
MLVMLAAAGPASAQQGQGKFITQASERLAKLVGEANGEGYKLASNKFSVGGGWLKQSSEWMTLYTINLEKGKNYRILAAGDNDARDVDVQLLDPNDKVMASDTKTDPEAVVDFRPKVSQRYQVRVRLFASRNDLPSLTLAIVMVK